MTYVTTLDSEITQRGYESLLLLLCKLATKKAYKMLLLLLLPVSNKAFLCKMVISECRYMSLWHNFFNWFKMGTFFQLLTSHVQIHFLEKSFLQRSSNPLIMILCHKMKWFYEKKGAESATKHFTMLILLNSILKKCTKLLSATSKFMILQKIP